jgi:hypothetical protein
VDNFVPKFGFLTVLSDSLAARRCLFRSLILLLFFGLVGSSAAASADVQKTPVTSVGPGQSFAIADFDGDLCPDLASIQPGANISGSTNYWIQLQLSALGRQSIHLTAPAGGLLIEARDVNGDQAVDLVLATAWFRQPVAIFLNDGHGSFSRAEPTAFRGAFTTSKKSLASTADEIKDAIAVLPSRDPTRNCSNGSKFSSPRSLRGVLAPGASPNLLFSAIVSFLGRAPPYFVFHII